MNDELTPESRSPEPDDGPVTQPADLAGPDTTAPASMFGPPSAGGMIRAARQAQGIDLASLAAMLKIPLRRIEALEQGRHDELQGATFERALAQAACRVLKIDPKPVLALLPQHERNTLEGVSEGLNTPFRERQGGGFGIDASMLGRPVVLVPLALVLAAAALLYMPGSVMSRWQHAVVSGLSSGPADAPSDAASAASAGSNAAAVALASPAASDAATDPPESASSPAAEASAAVTAPGPTSPQDASPATPVAVAAATAPAAVAPGADDALVHPAAAPGIPVQVVATADSWVEVVDAQGHSLLSRTVVAGESVGLDGALPMRVKVGNARGTRLTLRGDNVDLAPWTRDNVARLELK